jgi:hypothetical protein
LKSWVGQPIGPVKHELESIGVIVKVEPVIDRAHESGTVLSQKPKPPGPMPDHVFFHVVRNPETVSLFDCCVHVVTDPCFEWTERPVRLGGHPYKRGLRLTSDICGVDKHTLVIELPEELNLQRVRAVVGVDGDSEATSNDKARAIIKVDGSLRDSEIIDVDHPLIIRRDARNVARIEIVIRGSNLHIALAIAGVRGSSSA